MYIYYLYLIMREFIGKNNIKSLSLQWQEEYLKRLLQGQSLSSSEAEH